MASIQTSEFFVEKAAVLALIDKLLSHKGDATLMDPWVAELASTFDKYQEQPYLLDPHLEALVTPIMARVRSTLREWHGERVQSHASPSFSAFRVYSNPTLHRLLQVVYALCKTRGYKRVIKHFPHEVADVEPVVQALVCNDGGDHGLWETRYVLLLWLSILFLIPFDLSRVDSSLGGGGGGASASAPSSPATSGLVASSISLCKGFLADPGAVRDAAAVCLARLLTRPDMCANGRLGEFMGWAPKALAGALGMGGGGEGGKGGDEGEGALISAAGGGGGGAAGFLQGGGLTTTLGKGLHAMGSGGVEVDDVTGAPLTQPSLSSRVFLATGTLSAMVEIAKHGHRDTLVGPLGEALSRVMGVVSGEEDEEDEGGLEGGVEGSDGVGLGSSAAKSSSGGGGGGGGAGKEQQQQQQKSPFGTRLRGSPLLRKLLVKLAARTGLSYLPPRLMSWRYQRGQRSLLENLSLAGVKAATAAVEAAAAMGSSAAAGAAAAGSTVSSPPPAVLGASSESDVPPELEDILDLLLAGLRDSDTVVRWSSAKGIGRITSRLPADFGDDVVGAVLALCVPTESEAGWHGGCLALAELARRGLLLPPRLPEAVPAVLAALEYDVRRGAHSVGQHVRDAACYVCWAFARAYAPGVMAPHTPSLSRGILCCALFDREVNCRRAASAAFQESVGRQGAENFPGGIDILTAADYFALGNRANAFLRVAPAVAAMGGGGYGGALRAHLLGVKLKHWDRGVRELAAGALGVLVGEGGSGEGGDFTATTTTTAWALSSALPTLLEQCVSSDLFTRHGSILGVAEVCLGLARAGTTLPSDTLDAIRNTVLRVEKARGYTGRGGEAVRAAVCRLIQAQCLCGHPLSRKAGLRLLQTIDECLKHPNEAIQAAALAGLRALAASPCFVEAAAASSSSPAAAAAPPLEVIERLTRGYCTKLRDENPSVRRGAALALGVLPRALLPPTELESTLLDALITATQPEADIARRDAETRRNAVIGLCDVVCTVGFGASGGLSGEQVGKVVVALIHASHDYATDNRGDVGSWVRKAVVEGLERILFAWRAERGRVAALLLMTGGAGEGQEETRSLLLTHPPTVALGVLSAAAANRARASCGGQQQQLAYDPAFDTASAQYTSGYGNITGYGAGLRILPGGDGGLGFLAATPGAPVTSNGLLVGASVVHRVHGVGRLEEVGAGGECAKCTFAGGVVVPSLPCKSLQWAGPGGAARAGISPSSGAAAVLADAGLGPPLSTHLATLFPPPVIVSILEVMVRCAGEKLDLLRAVAGDALARVIASAIPGLLPTLVVGEKEEGEGGGVLDGFVRELSQVFLLPPHPGGGAAPLGVKSSSPQGVNDGEEEEEVEGGGEEEEGDGGEDSPVKKPKTSSLHSPSSSTHGIQWSIPHQCFPRLMPLLSALPPTHPFTPSLMEGLCVSVGGLSESVVKHSRGALCAWAVERGRVGDKGALLAVVGALVGFLRPRAKLPWEMKSGGGGGGGGGGSASMDPSLSRWFHAILGGGGGGGGGGSSSAQAAAAAAADSNATPATHRVVVRLVVPTLRTLDALLSCGALDGVKRLASGREDVPRVLATAAVMLGLLGVEAGLDGGDGGVRAVAMETLLNVLAHPFPLIRKGVAEKLYVKLLGEVATDDAVLQLLAETNWSGGLVEAREARDKLYPLLGVAMPEERMGVSEEDMALAERGGGGAGGGGGMGGVHGGGTGDPSTDGYGALAAEAGY